MRAVVQRVIRAQVRAQVESGWEETGAIDTGLLVLLGVAVGDTAADVSWMADKLAGLRLFEDAQGRMNLDVTAVGGALLVVSQFTLLGDVSRGRRPAFGEAMEPEGARRLYGEVCAALRARGLRVEEGRFRATMRVELTNEGPVTLLLESRRDRTRSAE